MADPASPSSVYRRVGVRLLPILFCCYLINYLDRVNLSFVEKEISTSLNLSSATYGFGAGLFFIGYFLFQVPSNLLLHRMGARRCISLIMVVWGIISACTAFVRTENEFFAARLLLGASEAGFFPGVILYLSWWYPAVLRARVVAVFLTAIPVAGLIGSPLSGWILENVHGGNLLNWQWLFLLEGAPCLLMAAWTFRALPDQPRDATWLSDQERRQLIAALETEARERAAKSAATMSAARAFRHPLVWKLCLLYFCTMMGLYGISFWLKRLITSLGWHGDLQIGLLSIIPWSFAVIFMLLLGAHSDRKQERRRHAAFASVVAAIGFAGCAVAHGAVPRLLAMSFAAAGVMGMMAVQWSMPSSLLGGSAAAAGIALINSFGNLGGFVSPTLIGRITQVTGNANWGMATTAAILLIPAAMLGWSKAFDAEKSQQP